MKAEDRNVSEDFGRTTPSLWVQCLAADTSSLAEQQTFCNIPTALRWATLWTFIASYNNLFQFETCSHCIMFQACWKMCSVNCSNTYLCCFNKFLYICGCGKERVQLVRHKASSMNYGSTCQRGSSLDVSNIHIHDISPVCSVCSHAYLSQCDFYHSEMLSENDLHQRSVD